ncbi:MAG: hypothetical protein NTX53_19550 [candidate division WOR-3 bacterium]|nr:hypothetical protein [candidate division WOR-3 bacterium]
MTVRTTSVWGSLPPAPFAVLWACLAVILHCPPSLQFRDGIRTHPALTEQAESLASAMDHHARDVKNNVETLRAKQQL